MRCQQYGNEWHQEHTLVADQQPSMHTSTQCKARCVTLKHQYNIGLCTFVFVYVYVCVRIEHVKQFKYLGKIIASDGTVKGEVSWRLGLAYAAFSWLGKQGTWKDKTTSRRTNLTIYKATVLTILPYCAETWSIGPEDVIEKLETAQMSCLCRVCGDRPWGPGSTPCAEIWRQCQMPSIGNLVSTTGSEG